MFSSYYSTQRLTDHKPSSMRFLRSVRPMPWRHLEREKWPPERVPHRQVSISTPDDALSITQLHHKKSVTEKPWIKNVAIADRREYQCSQHVHIIVGSVGTTTMVIFGPTETGNPRLVYFR